MQAIKAGARRTGVVNSKEMVDGMILKRLQHRKCMGWEATKRESQFSNLERTNETMKVLAIGRGGSHVPVLSSSDQFCFGLIYSDLIFSALIFFELVFSDLI